LWKQGLGLGAGLHYLPGVLRENDSIVPESTRGEERRALLLQFTVDPLLLLLIFLTTRRQQKASMARGDHRDSGVWPQEQEVWVEGAAALVMNNRTQGLDDQVLFDGDHPLMTCS